MRNITAIKKLKSIAKSKHTTELQKAVIDEIVYSLEDYKKADDLFRDLQENGCSSGMIRSLIYYEDTYKFFDNHYSDIMELFNDLEKQGVEIHNILCEKWNIKDIGARIAFEETAYRLAIKIGIKL